MALPSFEPRPCQHACTHTTLEVDSHSHCSAPLRPAGDPVVGVDLPGGRAEVEHMEKNLALKPAPAPAPGAAAAAAAAAAAGAAGAAGAFGYQPYPVAGFGGYRPKKRGRPPKQFR